MLTETDRALKIIKLFKKEYDQTRVGLPYNDPFELLIATILSAQCTDKRVNTVTPALFRKYPTVQHFAKAKLQDLEKAIKSTGIYRNKAKNIKSASKMIIERYNSKVPSTMKDLLDLPGVARKTANIVLTNAYGVIEGIAVDTHVKRLSQRLFLTRDSNPDRVEKDLTVLFPKEEWGNINYLFITHGRKICRAKHPLCSECVVNTLCPSAFKIK